MEPYHEARNEPGGLRERAQKSINFLLNKLGLEESLPTTSERRTIGILGAGVAIEVPVLDDYFSTETQRPKIIAIDRNEDAKDITQQFAQNREVDLDYRIGDLTDSSLYTETYDMVLIRKPDTFDDPQGWPRIFSLGYNHVKPGGIMLITTSEPEAFDFAREQMERLPTESLCTMVIPGELRVSAFFNETDMILVRKPTENSQTNPQVPSNSSS